MAGFPNRSSSATASVNSLPPSFWVPGSTYETVEPAIIAAVANAGGSYTQLVTTGTVFYSAIYLPNGTSPSTLYFNVQTAGTLASMYAGLYTATAQIGVSSTFNMNATGTVSAAISATSTGTLTGLSAGVYFVAILCRIGATTAPTLLGSPSGNTIANFGPGTTAGSLTRQASTLGSALSALPTTISGTPTSAGTVIYAGVS